MNPMSDNTLTNKCHYTEHLCPHTHDRKVEFKFPYEILSYMSEHCYF